MATTSVVLIIVSPLTSAAVRRHPERGVPILRKWRWVATTSTVSMPAEAGARAALAGVTVKLPPEGRDDNVKLPEPSDTVEPAASPVRVRVTPGTGFRLGFEQ